MLEQVQAPGKHFYMFNMMKPAAAELWSDAKATISSFIYWSSATLRKAVAETQLMQSERCTGPHPEAFPVGRLKRYRLRRERIRTDGFVSALYYHNSIEPFFNWRAHFAATIRSQLSLYGETDGMARLRKPDEKGLRTIIPG